MDVRRFMDDCYERQGMKLEVWREQLGTNFPEFQKSKKRRGHWELVAILKTNILLMVQNSGKLTSWGW